MEMNLKLISLKPDIFGAVASTLCVIHCILTPFLFLSNGAIYTKLNKTTFVWSNLDFIFILISFLAIYRSSQTTSKAFMKFALWTSWTCLFFLILNEKIFLFSIPGYLTHISALSLASFHIYNLKFCQCKSENCCAKKTK
tara:strand:- start:13770 stop:14189 length:420 start_codon:yes stop_codon:yes gene_type:complete